MPEQNVCLEFDLKARVSPTNLRELLCGGLGVGFGRYSWVGFAICKCPELARL
jgi:hypothetical protein